jgi:hypothetical protein
MEAAHWKSSAVMASLLAAPPFHRWQIHLPVGTHLSNAVLLATFTIGVPVTLFALPLWLARNWIRHRGNFKKFLFGAGLLTVSLCVSWQILVPVYLYEFATDHSSVWQRTDEFIENVTRIEPVWAPRIDYSDPATAYGQLTFSPQDPETSRHQARDWRRAVEDEDPISEFDSNGVEHGRHYQSLVRQILNHPGPVVQTDINAFHEAAVQWDILRFQQVCAALIGDYASRRAVTPDDVRAIQAFFQPLMRQTVTSSSEDGFLQAAENRDHVRMASSFFLNYAFSEDFHYGLRRVLKRLAERGSDPVLRTMAQSWLDHRPAPALTKAEDVALFVLTESYEARSRLYATRAEYDQALAYFDRMKKGPWRPVHIDDLDAVANARKELGHDRADFIQAGREYGVPSDVLASVALTNLMFNSFRPHYQLGGGSQINTTEAGATEEESSWTHLLQLMLPARVLDAFIDDRISDWLAGYIKDGSPTIGLLQNRAGPTSYVMDQTFLQMHPELVTGNSLDKQPTGEWNVRENHLWDGWGIRADDLSIRSINARLLEDAWSVRTAARYYANDLKSRAHWQKENRGSGYPDLDAIRRDPQWLARSYDARYGALGPDAVLSIGALLRPKAGSFGYLSPWWYFSIDVDNSKQGWTLHYLAYTRVLALEAGFGDSEHALVANMKIVGVHSPEQLEKLIYYAGQTDDPELAQAARRTIRELAEIPAFPAHDRARQYVLHPWGQLSWFGRLENFFTQAFDTLKKIYASSPSTKTAAIGILGAA